MVGVVGLCKNTRDQARLKKYSKLSNLSGQDLEEGQPEADETLNDTIPFGVRAIQQGVQIDGIWNSSVGSPSSSINGPSQVESGSESTSTQGRNVPSIVVTKPSSADLKGKGKSKASYYSESDGNVSRGTSLERSERDDSRESRGPHKSEPLPAPESALLKSPSIPASVLQYHPKKPSHLRESITTDDEESEPEPENFHVQGKRSHFKTRTRG